MKTIEIKQKLLEEALDQLKAAQQDCYVESTQNIIDELEVALRQPLVSGRSEQLACIHNLERLRLIGGNITCLDCQSTWVRQAN